MKVRLLRDAKIQHKAGETVVVSPAEANFLLSTKSAEIVGKKTTKKTEK